MVANPKFPNSLSWRSSCEVVGSICSNASFKGSHEHKHEHKYKAPHCDSVNKSWCFSTYDPMWQLGMKKDTHRENTSRNLDEIWMKWVEINFFWRFRFTISTSAFGNLGFNYPISHSSKSLQTGWGLLLSEFGNLGLATRSFYLFSQSMEFYYY
jgi:hypothetical protein